MPPPANVPDLIDRVRRSGIIPTDQLEGFLIGLQTAEKSPTTPVEMLGWMVDAGLITRFHAERLAIGKYKGFQLGSYLILDQIGTGGMGQVYLAEHVHMRRLVALKVLPSYSSNDPVEDAISRERFIREARAAGTLDHPNIVRVFDLCEEGKLLFLVMEYVEGISIQSLVNRFGPLGVQASCHYARQVAFGLQHAYELGFVHRDIKPANLLLDSGGVVKILDLGLVRSEADIGSGLTRQLDNKRILGTADYVAPEQAKDSSGVDIRADIYSLGATLYFMLTGRPLFPEGRTAQKLVWQQIKQPVPVDRLRPEVPAALATVIHCMLEKKPADRFLTPLKVFEALAHFVTDEIPLPNPLWLPEPPARVALARLAVPNANAPRLSGSTSKIVAAAMRTGSGSTSSSVIPRKDESNIDTASDSDKLTLNPVKLPFAPLPSPTVDMAADDTQRNPKSSPTPHPTTPIQPTTGSVLSPTVVIFALAISLVLALLGIIILLLR